MPSPKDGKAGKPVMPAAPTEPDEADVADPGEVESAKAGQRESETGKYGEQKAEPFKPPQSREEREDRKGWIEIELIDEDDVGVPGESYELTLPDGSVTSGTLDEKGFARLEGIESGTCQVRFPGLHEDAWEPA
jgi:type VI secretion system secreted protein VgrG